MGDFDQNGALSIGEWAGGLSVFFRGTPEDGVRALFNVLDRDQSQSLDKNELQEYLKPYVSACTPSRADALRPLLLKKTTDDIFNEMDVDGANDISSDEMLNWIRNNNSIIARVITIIDTEVYNMRVAETGWKKLPDTTNLKGGWQQPPFRDDQKHRGSQDNAIRWPPPETAPPYQSKGLGGETSSGQDGHMYGDYG